MENLILVGFLILLVTFVGYSFITNRMGWLKLIFFDYFEYYQKHGNLDSVKKRWIAFDLSVMIALFQKMPDREKYSKFYSYEEIMDRVVTIEIFKQWSKILLVPLGLAILLIVSGTVFK